MRSKLTPRKPNKTLQGKTMGANKSTGKNAGKNANKSTGKRLSKPKPPPRDRTGIDFLQDPTLYADRSTGSSGSSLCLWSSR